MLVIISEYVRLSHKSSHTNGNVKSLRLFVCDKERVQSTKLCGIYGRTAVGF